MAHPMAEGATQGATYAHPGGGDDGDDDEHRHRDDTRGDDDHTDVAQTGWTSNCVRGYARFMLAVWAGRGAQAASCLVIRPEFIFGGPGARQRPLEGEIEEITRQLAPWPPRPAQTASINRA